MNKLIFVRKKSYFFLQKSILKDEEKKLIHQVVYKLSAKKRYLSDSNLKSYFSKIVEILNKSSVDKSHKENIRMFFVEELKTFKIRSERRLAYDLTFSAPKSLSIASLIGGDTDIIKAHRSAVQEALKHVETHYSQIRIRDKHKTQRQVEVTGNIVVATFEHDVSRALDPQLHTHCVLMNFTKRYDDSWRSVYQDGFYYNSKRIGLVYQRCLAKKIISLGYQVKFESNGTFEIQGYTKEELQAFSKRAQQLNDFGAKTQKEKTQSIYKNRARKVDITNESLKEMWLSEARQLKIVHPIKNFHYSNLQAQKPPTSHSRSSFNGIAVKIGSLIYNTSKTQEDKRATKSVNNLSI